MTELNRKNSTTFTVNGLGDVCPDVTIGGKDENKFIPNVNMSFFDDEFFINLNRTGKTAIAIAESAQITGDDTDDFYIDENDRLKWDVIFDSCPESMALEWQIKCSDGIEFYYQGELTEKEIANGHERPEEIAGSYAVYCNQKHNKYKTGKLCHIPRPFVIDDEGEKEWATIDITDNVLTITLPELYMQSASYPVRLDPTFGYTSTGASIFYFQPTYAPRSSGLSSLYTSSSGDTITKFSFCGRLSYSGTADALEVATYSSSGGVPQSRLGAITDISVDSTTVQWWDSEAVSIGMNAGTTYDLCIIPYGWDNYCAVKYDSGGGNWVGKVHDTNESLPETWSQSDNHDEIYSIYATYTEGGGGNTASGSIKIENFAVSGEAVNIQSITATGSIGIEEFGVSGVAVVTFTIYIFSDSDIFTAFEATCEDKDTSLPYTKKTGGWTAARSPYSK